MELGEGVVALEESGHLEPGHGGEQVIQLPVLLVVGDVQVHQLLQLGEHAHLTHAKNMN